MTNMGHVTNFEILGPPL